jgi:hypothetical protein
MVCAAAAVLVDHRVRWRDAIANSTNHDKAALRSLAEVKDVPPIGTTDLFFGPVAPASKEGQWIMTNPGSGWFVYLRLYGPDGPAFDGRWKPGDFEEIAPTSIGRALQ